MRDNVFENHIWPMLEADGWFSYWAKAKSRTSTNGDNMETFYVPPKGPQALGTTEQVRDYVLKNNDSNKYVKEFILCCKDVASEELDETYFISKVEEMMLFRNIEQSLHYRSAAGQETEQSPQQNNTTIKSKKSSISRKENPPTKCTSPKKSNTSETEIFVKEMPRYIGSNHSFDITLLFPLDKVKCLFIENILTKNNLSNHRDSKKLLQVKVENRDEHTVIFSARGEPDLVAHVKSVVQCYTKGIIIMQNLTNILNDPESIILNVNLLATKRIGAFVYDIPELDKVSAGASMNWKHGLSDFFFQEINKLEAGVWITSLNKDRSELRKVFSSLVVYGACILKVDNVHVKTVQEIASAWKCGKKNKKKFIKLTLCISKRANLSTVDPKRVVLDSDGVLKKRGGGACSTWSFDADKGFVRKITTNQHKLYVTQSNINFLMGDESDDGSSENKHVTKNESSATKKARKDQRRSTMEDESVDSSVMINCSSKNKLPAKEKVKKVLHQAMITDHQSIPTKDLDTIRNEEVLMSNGANSTKPAENISKNSISQIKKLDCAIGTKTQADLPSLPVKLMKEKKLLKPSESQLQEREFSIVYDPHKPLDFYCITEEIAINGTKKRDSICTIYSVCPYAVRNDDRIQPGTIIVASSLVIGNSAKMRVNLSSYSALEKRYLDAKTKGSSCSLQIIFASRSGSMYEKSSSIDYWTKSGQWRGPSTISGWAGGAKISLKRKDFDDECPPKKRKACFLRGCATGTSESNAKRRNCSDVDAVSREENAEETNKVTQKASAHCVQNLITNKNILISGAELNLKRQTCVDNDALARKTSLEETHQAQSKSFNANQNNSLRNLIQKRNNLEKVQRPTANSQNLTSNSALFTENQKKHRSDDKKDKRHVSFSRNLATYDEYCIQSTASRNEITATEKDSQSADALVMAIKTQGIQNVTELLKSGKVDAQCKDSHGKSPMNYVDNIIKDIKDKIRSANQHSAVAQTKALQDKLKDFQLKKKLLKIFINLVFYVNHARFLEDWETIQFFIDKVHNLHLSSQRNNNITSPVFCRTTYDGKKQELFNPAQPFAQGITWDGGMKLASNSSCRQNFPCCTVRYNEMLNNNPSIIIDLIMKDLEHNECQLGTASLSKKTVRELIGHLIKAGRGHKKRRKLTSDISSTQFLENGAKIELTLLKLDCDKDFESRKNLDNQRKLKNVIDWIQEFNIETAQFVEGGDNLLDYNICAQNCNGFTLLHAAIYIQDPDMVKRLLKLGADPRMLCAEGTAFDLSQMLFEHHKQYNNCFPGSVDVLNVMEAFADVSGKDDAFSNKSIDETTPDIRRYEQSDKAFGEEFDIDLQRSSTSVVETLEIKSKTCNCAENKSYDEYLPIVADTDWMITNGTVRCKNFNQPTGCPLGSKCKDSHVHNPVGALLKCVELISIKELFNAVNDKRITTINILGKNGKIYYTAAYKSLTNVIYYSEKGRDWEQSKQGLYWYRDAVSAEDAVRRVVVAARYSLDQVSLPDLPNPDWMCSMLRRPRCDSFEKKNSCRYSNRCKKLHFSEISSSDLKFNPSIMSSMNECDEKLQEENIYYNTVKAINDGSNWYTAAYVHPKNKLIFYADSKYDVVSGKNLKVKISQGLFWYPSKRKALDSVRKVVHAYTLGKDDGAFDALVAISNFDVIHVKIHAKHLKRSYWNTSCKHVDGEKLFTATLNPHTLDYFVVFPRSCDGVYHSGVYWYKSPALARTVTYFTYLQGLVKRNILKDLRHMLDGSVIY